MLPLILQLTAGQQIEYARIADELHAIGFESEPFGNRTIAVTAAPAAVGPADLEKVLVEILEIAEGEFRGPRWRTCAAPSAPPSPATPRSRSTPAWTLPKWNGCCARWRPRIAP